MQHDYAKVTGYDETLPAVEPLLPQMNFLAPPQLPSVPLLLLVPQTPPCPLVQFPRLPVQYFSRKLLLHLHRFFSCRRLAPLLLSLLRRFQFGAHQRLTDLLFDGCTQLMKDRNGWYGQQVEIIQLPWSHTCAHRHLRFPCLRWRDISDWHANAMSWS